MIKSNLRITFFLWYIKLRLKVECDNLNVKVMNMKKMELRHTKILELLTEKNKVDVTELSQNLGVSQVTIRKDLDMLEKKGLIVREHGFATLNGQDDMNNRLAYHYDIKQQLAKSACQMIEDKTNEIPTIPLILDKINVKGNIIAWDALNTQKTNVETVIKLKGEYVVPLKQNQGTFYNDLVLYFDEKKLECIKAGNSQSAYKKQIEKCQGNIVTYEYFQTEDISWFQDLKKWKGIKSFGLVKKTIISKHNTIAECRYYISSLYNDIETFSNAIRLHWSVENKLHWHLDFTFKQDENSTMDKNALFNLQILKKLSLAFLNDVKRVYNTSLKNIRFKLSLNYETEILRFFNILAH